MAEPLPVLIREAIWPADNAAATALLNNYADDLVTRLPPTAHDHIADQRAELATLQTLWSPPDGALLIAFLGDTPAGCVALKLRHDRPATVELKRLWTEPSARGRGFGRRLAQAAIDWSRSHGYRTVLLDTLPSAMPQAVALYRSLGFHETIRHNDNPVQNLAYFQFDLP